MEVLDFNEMMANPKALEGRYAFVRRVDKQLLYPTFIKIRKAEPHLNYRTAVRSQASVLFIFYNPYKIKAGKLKKYKQNAVLKLSEQEWGTFLELFDNEEEFRNHIFKSTLLKAI